MGFFSELFGFSERKPLEVIINDFILDYIRFFEYYEDLNNNMQSVLNKFVAMGNSPISANSFIPIQKEKFQLKEKINLFYAKSNTLTVKIEKLVPILEKDKSKNDFYLKLLRLLGILNKLQDEQKSQKDVFSKFYSFLESFEANLVELSRLLTDYFEFKKIKLNINSSWVLEHLKDPEYKDIISKYNLLFSRTLKEKASLVSKDIIDLKKQFSFLYNDFLNFHKSKLSHFSSNENNKKVA